MKKASSIFAVVIGFSMFIMWSILLLTGQVVELAGEPLRVAAHLFSEGIAAAFLICGGLRSMKRKKKREAIHLISLGLSLYSVLTAGGYYLQLGDLAMTVLFSILLVLTAIFISSNVTRKLDGYKELH